MRLLFDHNLYPRLIRLLCDVYTECTHVHHLGMDTASYTEIWNYAAEQGFTIVSKEADFHQRSLVRGAPPKVVWIRQGNCSVSETADLLRERFIAVERFHAREEAAFLALS